MARKINGTNLSWLGVFVYPIRNLNYSHHEPIRETWNIHTVGTVALIKRTLRSAALLEALEPLWAGRQSFSGGIKDGFFFLTEFIYLFFQYATKTSLPISSIYCSKQRRMNSSQSNGFLKEHRNKSRARNSTQKITITLDTRLCSLWSKITAFPSAWEAVQCIGLVLRKESGCCLI